ncbi:Uncharacterized conserved protein [Aedoeadaptatus ivorii]|uniref:Uncharacterized conserved protein n=1 Tax=Aedoeadaptatus ivorii TaxID=54006 RepID=A0A448V2S7_9FIRM|nr:hemerythrin domain-containing protein [Peptoniphilus ivorii]MDQ0508788.1 hemerythrin-like domain-containing protein [Peptoniphilus ivorii]VEJ36092.1 Uncharacterized conserved protein [Peptoniphilus ivorii]
MYGIEVLVREHDNILRFTRVIRRYLLRAMDGEILFLDELSGMIDFIRNYSDAHHHGKEEEILFHYMLEDGGDVAEKIVRQGMLVEHDQARGIVRDLEAARIAYESEASAAHLLDIFGLLYAYVRLLEAHAARENEVVYPFGERALSEEKKASVDAETRAFEEEGASVKEKQLSALARWEEILDGGGNTD